MNRIFKFTAPLFGLLFLGVLFLSFRTIASFSFRYQTEEPVKTGKYTFSFYLPAEDYPYYNKIRQGAAAGAAELGCVVSFYPVNINPVSMEMAPWSGIDGAAVYPLGDDPTVQDRVKALTESNLPMVMIEHLLLTDPSLYLIGTNSYDVGKKIAELVISTYLKTPNMAFLYSEKNPGLLADRNVLEMGFHSILGDRPHTVVFGKTNSNPLDAENLVYSLLKENPEINLLILTDPNDTMAALQVIVDQNLVGKVDIIGFGDDPTILDYIDKGVLQGTVVRNPYQIGYRAIQSLYEIAETGSSSSMVDVEVQIVSRVNLSSFQKEVRDAQ